MGVRPHQGLDCLTLAGVFHDEQKPGKKRLVKGGVQRGQGRHWQGFRDSCLTPP